MRSAQREALSKHLSLPAELSMLAALSFFRIAIQVDWEKSTMTSVKGKKNNNLSPSSPRSELSEGLGGGGANIFPFRGRRTRGGRRDAPEDSESRCEVTQ